MKNLETEPEVQLVTRETHVKILRSGFRSAHALINSERAQRGRKSLTRSRYLDGLCQLHAEYMAEIQELEHSVESTDDLKFYLNSEHAGENIQRGKSVQDMHEQAMSAYGGSAYKNIVGKKFREFGIATARSVRDGKLYMVQLFRGRELEANTSFSDSLILDESIDDGIGVDAQLLESASIKDAQDLSQFLEGARTLPLETQQETGVMALAARLARAQHDLSFDGESESSDESAQSLDLPSLLAALEARARRTPPPQSSALEAQETGIVSICGHGLGDDETMTMSSSSSSSSPSASSSSSSLWTAEYVEL